MFDWDLLKLVPESERFCSGDNIHNFDTDPSLFQILQRMTCQIHSPHMTSGLNPKY